MPVAAPLFEAFALPLLIETATEVHAVCITICADATNLTLGVPYIAIRYTSVYKYTPRSCRLQVLKSKLKVAKFQRVRTSA